MQYGKVVAGIVAVGEVWSRNPGSGIGRAVSRRIDRSMSSRSAGMKSSGGKHGFVGPQDGRTDFTRRTILAAPIRDAANFRRPLQVGDGAAIRDPYLLRRNVALRDRVV